MDQHTTDERGKIILSLCKNSALRILDGRTPGDLKGCQTRYPSRLRDNPITIDYTLCSEPLINDVLSFSVLPFNGLSDHCCISLTMKSNINVGISPLKGRKDNDDQLNVNKQTFKFYKTIKNIYEQTPRDDLIVEELRYVRHCAYIPT